MIIHDVVVMLSYDIAFVIDDIYERLIYFRHDRCSAAQEQLA